MRYQNNWAFALRSLNKMRNFLGYRSTFSGDFGSNVFLKLQFHPSKIIYVHIWILCMSWKSIHPFWSVISPLSPRLTTFFANLPFISLLLRFPSCVGNQKSVPAPLHQALFRLLLARFSGYSQNTQVFPFPPLQKLISSYPDDTLSPDKLLGNFPPLAALLQASHLP